MTHYTCNGSPNGCEGERFGGCDYCESHCPKYQYDQQHTDSINANFSEADQFSMFNVAKDNQFGVSPWTVNEPEAFKTGRVDVVRPQTAEERAARVENMRQLYAVLEPQGISPFSDDSTEAFQNSVW